MKEQETELTLIATSPTKFYEGLSKVLRDVLDTKLNELQNIKYDENLLSNTEAAKMLRLSKQTLKKYCDQGDIPYRVIGRRYMFVKSDLIDYLKKAEPEVWK